MEEAGKATNANVQIPLAIMVSDDTAARTEALLKENNYFGMAEGQVSLVLVQLAWPPSVSVRR